MPVISPSATQFHRGEDHSFSASTDKIELASDSVVTSELRKGKYALSNAAEAQFSYQFDNGTMKFSMTAENTAKLMESEYYFQWQISAGGLIAKGNVIKITVLESLT